MYQNNFVKGRKLHMMVCAHGNVAEFCESREMVICDTWGGEILEYRGVCRVLVTDSDMSYQEYCYAKGVLLGRGVELISTVHKDDQLLSEYLVYSSIKKIGGRRKFNDATVIDKIITMSEAGATLREIQANDGVHNSDGKRLSISTISKIIKERRK